MSQMQSVLPSASSLHEPTYNGVMAIDDRLKQLELEAQEMENKYQFIK